MPIFSNFPMMAPGEFIQMDDDNNDDYIAGFGGQEEQVVVSNHQKLYPTSTTR